MSYKTVLFIVVISITNVITAQSSLKAGIKSYDFLYYNASVSELSSAIEKSANPESEALEKLANAYYFIGNMEKAAEWYAKLFSRNEPIADSELYYRYAMSLKTLLDYEEAKEWMAKFAEANPDDSRAKIFEANPDYLENISNLSGNYELDTIDFNSDKSDFGTSFYKDGIVFASSRGEATKDELYEWNGQPFLDLYFKKEGSEEVVPFSYDLNTKFHESSTSFTKDGTTIYFTRNNYYNGIEEKNEKRETGLKIYKATLSGEYWTDITPLPFNNNNYNVAHPALSPDGTKLYFSSDMPGSLGQSDIYVVDVFNGGKTYGKPENLGPTVNTSGRENFPFVSEEGVLYFSSDGHPGLGGLDVFKYVSDNGAGVVNVGRPVNSPHDDFEFIIDDQKQVGFFTSNRSGGAGDDDLYKIKVYNCNVEVGGVVLDKKTNVPISGASVTIIDAEGKEVQQLTSNAKGGFGYATDCKTTEEYTIKVDKEGYNAYNKTFTVEAKNESPLNITAPLEQPEPKVKAAEVGVDLFKLLNMNPIYFDVNKAAIRPDAQIELQKIINYMKEFPTVKIDVRSHTDSRGSDAYNLSLSKKRNTSTKNWIITKGGIAPDRIGGKGYGETQILNRCKNGVKCTKKEHEQNRRSEFIVTAN